MKPKKALYVFSFLVFAFSFTQCSNKEAPVLTTSDITAVSISEAVSGGIILSDGGGKITSKGLCWKNALERWSFPQEPTINDHKSIEGSGSDAFKSSLTGLDPGTTYYVRAYAVNKFGIGYGPEKTFKTSGDLPSASAEAATNISAFAAEINGYVDPNEIPTTATIEYGPTINYGQKISFTQEQITGQVPVRLTASITNLSPNSTYHFRIKAENALGFVYSEDMTFKTQEIVVDIDGFSYEVVTIGNQKWMKENLKTTRYRDGSVIPLLSSDTLWSSAKKGAYSSYRNINSDIVSIGALYNWYAVNDSRGLCPTGWHVPSNEEMTALTTYLGGVKTAGGKMKDAGYAHWLEPNTGADNSSLFSATGTGFRDRNGAFSEIKKVCYIWSGSEYSETHAIARKLYYNTESISFSGNYKECGFAVRCIKD